MKKYNLSKIMKRAWEIKKEDSRNIFALCLEMAWEQAKKESEETTMNLKEMTIDELKELQKAINTEIVSRQPKKELVLYTHDCQDAANYHLRKYNHWAKLLKGIDKTKTNGYAFVGGYLEVTEEHMIPDGSIVVEVCSDNVTAYRVTESGKENIGECKYNKMRSLIVELAKIME